MRIKVIILICCFLSTMCIGCVPDQYEPEEGVWYCEELQIQLSYEPDEECYIIKDGEKIICACGSDRGVNRIHVSCQQKHKDYYLDEMIFSATIIRLEKNELIVYDEQTKQQYIFYRKRKTGDGSIVP